MSLIVARKAEGEIIIVSDTKLSIQNEDKTSGERRKSAPIAGVIKVTLISLTICVAFAGGEYHAEVAIRKIKPNDALDTIVSILLDAHLECNGDTDFIIACGHHYKLFEIKKGECNEVEASWIGSSRAFSFFQNAMQKNNKLSERDIPKVLAGDDRRQWILYLDMVHSLDEVISNEVISEVGGYRISVTTEDGVFQYNSYRKNLNTVAMIEKPIMSDIIETAEEGGYSLNFFLSKNINYAALHVLQGNFGILYERKNGGLLRPRIMSDMDEVDFIEYAEYNFGIRPELDFQDRVQKYYDETNKAFDELDFERLLYWANKGVLRCSGKERAIFYYRKAFALVKLSQYSEVPYLLQQAVRIDNECAALANDLMYEIRNEQY